MNDEFIQSDELTACQAYEEVMALFTPAERREIQTTLENVNLPF